MVRIIRSPYFGKIGEVVSLPPELQQMESETMVRVAEIKVNGEKIYKVQAVYYILKKIKRYLILRIALKLLPLFLTNFCYDLIASSRYRIFGKYDTCFIPDKKTKKNYID